MPKKKKFDEFGAFSNAGGIVGVTYRFDIELEDQPVRGNFASDDPEEDRKLEDTIIARLERGEIEAWCYVRVTATIKADGQVFQGRAGMGGNSYDSERQLRKDLFEEDSHGLKVQALDNLKSELQETIKRASLARKVLKALK